MLILDRKDGDIVMVGDGAVIILGGHVKLGLDFPRAVSLVRGEVADEPNEAALRLRGLWRAHKAR